MFLGDHKEVYRCLGGNILESQTLVIFVQNAGGRLPSDDFTENGVSTYALPRGSLIPPSAPVDQVSEHC